MFKAGFKNQGGVIIIMALVVLVIASVLAVTFATSMRQEEKTAATFREGEKVSYVTQAGYEYALAILKKDKSEESARPYDALNEEWRTLFNGSGEGEEPEEDLDGVDNNGLNSDGKDARWIYLHSDPAQPTSKLIGRFAVLIVDEASKINLHASGSGAQNQGWTPFEIDLTNLDGFDSDMASNLINYREGDKSGGGVNDRDPGGSGDDDNDNIPLENDGIDNDGNGEIDEAFEGTNEPDEYVSRIPYGTGDELDFALKLVDELTEVNGIGKDTMRMCKNFTTIDAQDRAGYWDGAAWASRENINALTSVDILFNLFAAGTTNENAARWSTNTVDYGDRDSVPTAIETGGKKYLGIEGLQINEVMASVHPDAIAYHKEALCLDNRVDWQAWDDPSSFTASGSWNNDGGVAFGVGDGGTDTWTWPWDNGTYDIYVYRDSSCTGMDFDYIFQNSDPANRKEGTTDFGSYAYYLVSDITITTDQIELTLTARNIVTEIISRFGELRFLEPGHDPDDVSDGTRLACKELGAPFVDPDPYPPADDPIWPTNLDTARGIVDDGEDIWAWDVSDGIYDVYLYQSLYEGKVTNPYDFIFEEGEAGGELTGTATFGGEGTDTWYHVGNVTVTDGLNLKLIANYTAAGRSWFDKIGIFAGKYVELVNLSVNPITINKNWGINVGGDIILENNTAKIVPSTGTTYKFSWFEGEMDEFTIPGSSWPDYSYFIAADSRYALDYNHAYGADFKDGIWGTTGNESNEPGDLGVIGDLKIPDAGGVNISLVKEVNGEEIVVDFVPCTTTASGFGTSAWDTVTLEVDKSVERNSAYKDDSSWALTSEGWGQGTPGAVNTGGASVTEAVKDRPFASPGFMTEVYKGTGDYATNKLTTSDIKDFVTVLTNAYYRLEAENSTSPPAWATDTGLDGTTRYIAPTAGSNATLTWTGLHIPDGTYNLFVAGGIGGKFQCPSGTPRVMRPDGLVYCGTADIAGGSLTVDVYGDGTNLYSLDYILLTPVAASPPVIGKININTSSEQVLNALPYALATGGLIIDYRNGADNKDGTADDNPFENIGEYLSISGLSEPMLAEAFQKEANLITVRSDIFEIIVLGEAIEDLVNSGQYDPPPTTWEPETPGEELMSDEIIGQQKIRAIVDRSDDPPKVLYFRRELK